jgi:hypothetical protein
MTHAGGELQPAGWLGAVPSFMATQVSASPPIGTVAAAAAAAGGGASLLATSSTMANLAPLGLLAGETLQLPQLPQLPQLQVAAAGLGPMANTMQHTTTPTHLFPLGAHTALPVTATALSTSNSFRAEDQNACIALEVGGVKYRTTLATLLAVPGSLFYDIVYNTPDPDTALPRTPAGEFFIDRLVGFRVCDGDFCIDR